MRRARAIGVGAIAFAQLAGCRDALGIRETTLLVDAGGVDAPADAEHAAPTFCGKLAPAPQYCADFEKGELLAGWDSEGLIPDPAVHGGAALEELREASGRKLLVTTPALVTTGLRAGANLFLTLPVRPSRLLVRAQLTMITEEHQPGNEALVIQLVFGNEGAVVIYRDAQGAAVAVVPGGKAARFPSWPVGTPHVIALSVDNAPVRGPDGVAEASIDGALGPQLIVPARFQNAGPPTVVIGLRAFAPVGAMRLVVDDVALYWGG